MSSAPSSGAERSAQKIALSKIALRSADAAGHAAVDAYDGTGDVGSSVAAQKRRHVCVLLGPAVAPQRDGRRTVAHHVVGGAAFTRRPALVEKPRAVSLDPPGHDDIGSHAVTPTLVGDGLRPRMQA